MSGSRVPSGPDPEMAQYLGVGGGSGRGVSMQSEGQRYSNPDLNDFYDGSVPPPHRINTLYASANSISNNSNRSYLDPFSSRTSLDAPGPSSTASPRFLSQSAASPLPATASTAFSPLPTSEHAAQQLEDQQFNNPNPYLPPAQFGYNRSAAGNMNSGSKEYTSMGNSGTSAWLEEQQARNRRSKWMVIGSVIGIAVLVAVGVTVGVVVSKTHKSSSSSDLSSSSDENSTVTQTDPNDPSTFERDDRLKQSFYGIAYTPEGSQYPACGNELSQVINDIQLLSQLTTRLRLYGADCNQSSLVLEAIKQTKVNMTVWLGNYIIPTDDTPYERQKGEIKTALQAYGTDNIGGITVGNEFMLNYLNAYDNGEDDPNGTVGSVGAQLLISNITDTRQMLSDMGISDIPVGTSDAGAYFNDDVLNSVDYGMANVHPWFANVSIDQAAGWTWEFFQDTDVAAAQATTKKPSMYIAETGWPTNSSDAGNESNGPSTASIANLNTFLADFVCQSNTNGTQYFFFEYFDEIWKDQQFGGVEGWWGLFNSNRTLKDGLTIPDCTSS